ncbi:hypothetical protein [Leminorella grimontii]|uniref:hypothetical protein n=1 Tax=Leminorella grimontii TaxID=82981 RepID=UPI00208B648E|nr:hypothetical protein [Leminorella grimontii]GKX59649.1 hypothetical protein SOASR031_19640 [Leminorella grimontii]
MAISKKSLRKIIRNDREFFWCVREDDDDDGRLYLVIFSEDRTFHISYMLDQKNRELQFSPPNPFIIVKGKEFKGLDGLGKYWERFLTPDWESKVMTPSLVAKIIDWCLAVEEVTSVNFRGEIMSDRRTL